MIDLLVLIVIVALFVAAVVRVIDKARKRK